MSPGAHRACHSCGEPLGLGGAHGRAGVWSHCRSVGARRGVERRRSSVLDYQEASEEVGFKGTTGATVQERFGPSPGPSSPATLAAGWNLVSAAAWLPISGPIAALSADGSAYEEVLPTELEDDRGYWLYLDQSATLTIHAPYAEPRTVPLPAGQWASVTSPVLVMCGASKETPAFLQHAAEAGLGELYVAARTLAEMGKSPLVVARGLLPQECRALFEEWRAAGLCKPY